MHPIFVQAFYYGVAMLLTLFIVAFLFRGFFWKYIQVKMSMGRLVLIKIRSSLRDYYKVGEVIDNNLVYKTKDSDGKKAVIRINIPKDVQYFYKSIGVNWIDVDEEKNALMSVSYKPATGFDAIKWNNLFIRALTRPTVGDQKEKIIIILLVVVIIACLGAVYFGYMNYKELLALKKTLPQLIELAKHTATITPPSTI